MNTRTNTDGTQPHVALGVSDPIDAGATPVETRSQLEPMVEALDRDAPAETKEGEAKRARILKSLEGVVREWAMEIGMQAAQLDESDARFASAKIFLFGSMKLGVMAPNSDIDCVCVVPKHITREHFFNNLVAKLEEVKDKFKMSEINPVETAHTPLIEMMIEGQAVDLGFARLNLPHLRDVDSLLDDTLLVGLDEKSARGINGNRVNEMILRLVPNVEVFRIALRFIKHWSKRRGVSNNMLGYFGGIVWAILVARICQLYPNYNAAGIVHRFFMVYDQWNWGYERPVLLQTIDQIGEKAGLNHLRVWNPHNSPHDRQHLMPIITPAFPAMNSTHNVFPATKRVIQAEIKRARAYTQAVFEGSKEWSDVYAKAPFFGMHRQYLRVQLLARNPTAFNRWEGFVESKLRRLFSTIEQMVPGVELHPCPDKFPLGPDSENITRTFPQGKQMFVGVSFPKETFDLEETKSNPPDLRPAVEKFCEGIQMMMKQENYSESLQDLFITQCTRETLPDELKLKDFEAEMAQEAPLETEIKDGAKTGSLKRQREQEAEENTIQAVSNQSVAPKLKTRKKIEVVMAS
ncbi:unnamed protein product [Amoebophrya sp. A120]|nr:unnamed protein product [Amoebophrya sp. A120]|eukprot:GSA120T00012921001.1